LRLTDKGNGSKGYRFLSAIVTITIVELAAPPKEPPSRSFQQPEHVKKAFLALERAIYRGAAIEEH